MHIDRSAGVMPGFIQDYTSIYVILHESQQNGSNLFLVRYIMKAGTVAENALYSQT